MQCAAGALWLERAGRLAHDHPGRHAHILCYRGWDTGLVLVGRSTRDTAGAAEDSHVAW